jgi:uncharacterized membrane protein
MKKEKLRALSVALVTLICLNLILFYILGNVAMAIWGTFVVALCIIGIFATILAVVVDMIRVLCMMKS